MKRAISAADANREFSTVLRRVREGHVYIVTSHGRPVARIVPVTSGEEIGTAARTALFKRLEAARALAIPKWAREELYEH